MEYIVSFIIPVYNVEKYIRRSLYTALNQTFRSIEYIIVDDCGTDKSMDIIHEVLNGHPRHNDVRIYRHRQNRGLSAARNTGMKVATGKYIFFMDSDDEITLDCIEKHYMAVSKDDASFSIANVKLVGSTSIHIKDFSDDCVKEDLLSSFLRRKWSVNAWNKLYLKSFLKENALSFQDGLLFEDILWSYNLCLHTDKVTWIKDRTYIYKVRKNSITASQNNSRKIESILFILNVLIGDYVKGVIDKKYTRDLAFMVNFYRLNASLLLLNYAGSKNEAASYYKQLSSGCLELFHPFSFQVLVLKLPFVLFKIFLGPIYYLYKIVK